MTDLAGAPTADPAVRMIFEDYLALRGDLESDSPSNLAAINRAYHKHLLVAAASSLESQVKRMVAAIFESHGGPEFASFVDSVVMSRQYHTLFDWRNQSATGFFSNFGEACGKSFRSALREDDLLKRRHDAFMRLGALRNQVVHNDYAQYSVDLTPENVMAYYEDACAFVSAFEQLVLVGRHEVGRQKASPALSGVETEDAARHST